MASAGNMTANGLYTYDAENRLKGETRETRGQERVKKSIREPM